MRVLGERYRVVENREHIRSKIVLAAARLFAEREYAAVGIRDVAEAVGVHPRTIYHYFSSKQSILESVLDRSKSDVMMYYRVLEESCGQADTIEEIVYNLFVELKNITDTFNFYGLAAAVRTQFLFERSSDLFYGVFVKHCIQVVTQILDSAVERGLAGPFDTGAVAALVSASVIASNSIRVGQFSGHYTEYDLNRWFDRQAAGILAMIPKPGETFGCSE